MAYADHAADTSLGGRPVAADSWLSANDEPVSYLEDVIIFRRRPRVWFDLL